MTKYGETIRTLRENAGMTKEELARHLLVLPREIDGIESGDIVLSSVQINYAANTFGVDYYSLMEGVVRDRVSDEFIKGELSAAWKNLKEIENIFDKLAKKYGFETYASYKESVKSEKEEITEKNEEKELSEEEVDKAEVIMDAGNENAPKM